MGGDDFGGEDLAGFRICWKRGAGMGAAVLSQTTDSLRRSAREAICMPRAVLPLPGGP